MLPLISTLALHPSQRLKSFAQHALCQLQPLQNSDSALKAQHAAHALTAKALHGVPVLLQQAEQKLAAMSRWSSQQQQPEQEPQQQAQQQPDDNAEAETTPQQVLPPLDWLSKLTKALQQIRAATAEPAGDWESSQQDEVVKMILIALLDHPEPCVQAAAAEACGEAVQTFPLAGISFLPLLMYKLRRSVADGARGVTILLPDFD